MDSTPQISHLAGASNHAMKKRSEAIMRGNSEKTDCSIPVCLYGQAKFVSTSAKNRDYFTCDEPAVVALVTMSIFLLPSLLCFFRSIAVLMLASTPSRTADGI